MTTETEAFTFFCALSGRLEITLSEQPEKIAETLMNMAAPSSAQIQSLHINWGIFEDHERRELSEAEWTQVAVRASSVFMKSSEGSAPAIEHHAADGVAFTVRDLARAVEETERVSRPSTGWFGGIDIHHVYFEGLELQDGTYTVLWGS